MIELKSIKMGIDIEGHLFPQMTNEAYDFSEAKHLRAMTNEWFDTLSENDLKIVVCIGQLLDLTDPMI